MRLCCHCAVFQEKGKPVEFCDGYSDRDGLVTDIVMGIVVNISIANRPKHKVANLKTRSALLKTRSEL